MPAFFSFRALVVTVTSLMRYEDGLPGATHNTIEINMYTRAISLINLGSMTAQ